MQQWTLQELIKEGYTIENAVITSADLSMADHGALVVAIGLHGNSWVTTYGGYVIGRGYLGAKNFVGSKIGTEFIMRIMDTVGVEKYSDLKGKYIRIAYKQTSDPIKIIGNIISDKWFDYEATLKGKETEKE